MINNGKHQPLLGHVLGLNYKHWKFIQRQSCNTFVIKSAHLLQEINITRVLCMLVLQIGFPLLAKVAMLGT